MAMATTIHFITLMHVCTIVAVTNKCIALTLPNFSCILVFGDSTVDSGNNNYFPTIVKGNHFPYGKDFPGHVPTGRFSNGILVPDFLASYLNIKDTVPPFLDPNLSNEQLLTGVSFASAMSGFDDLTGVADGALSVSKQIEYFKDYVTKLKCIEGEDKAKQILGDALVIITAGTNDFIFNFYDLPTRKWEYNLSGYQDYLHDRLQMFIKDLYDLGCRKFGISGLPPIGCIPVQITLKFAKGRKCVEIENSNAELYNRKLAGRLLQIQGVLPGTRVVYANLYEPVINIINQHEKYGMEITNGGCCGSGVYEVSPFCTEFTPLCDDASKYVFWDSVHATELTILYLAKYMETVALPQFQF